MLKENFSNHVQKLCPSIFCQNKKLEYFKITLKVIHRAVFNCKTKSKAITMANEWSFKKLMGLFQ